MDYKTVLMLTIAATITACTRQKRDTPQCKDCEQYCFCLPDVKMSPDVRKKHDALAECTEIAKKKAVSEPQPMKEQGETKYQQCMKRSGYDDKEDFASRSGRICPNCNKPVLSQLMVYRKKRSTLGGDTTVIEEDHDSYNRELIACLAKKGMSSPDSEEWNKFYDEQRRLFNDEYDYQDKLCDAKHCLQDDREVASVMCNRESETAEPASGDGSGYLEKK